MIDILEKAKIIVSVGTGGVGKTTLSAGLGLLAAQIGRKVLVLTIDPSQRLKTTLNLKNVGEWTRIDIPGLKGELSAGVIDSKKTFDEFVLRAAEKSPGAKSILDNKLYQQLSTNLSGSQEFTALENLYQASQKGDFDLIVLDTPPAQHAIDFMHAPQKLAAIFSEGVAKWFRDPKTEKSSFWSGLVQGGTRQVLKVLESLTGSEFMGQLSQFFAQIHAWQGKLEKRAIESHRLLVDSGTHFVLVTGFDEAKFREAENFAREIKKGGYHLSALLVNKAYPMWMEQPEEKLPAVTQSLKDSMTAYYQKRAQKTLDLKRRVGGSFGVYEIPELPFDIAGLPDVIRFADELRKVIRPAGDVERGENS